jgi:hypothetical protein
LANHVAEPRKPSVVGFPRGLGAAESFGMRDFPVRVDKPFELTHE